MDRHFISAFRMFSLFLFEKKKQTKMNKKSEWNPKKVILPHQKSTILALQTTDPVTGFVSFIMLSV